MALLSLSQTDPTTWRVVAAFWLPSDVLVADLLRHTKFRI